MTTIRESKYLPAWWLPGPHLMTIFAAVGRRRPAVRTQRERFELADGDFVDLDWAFTSVPPDAPLVIVLHGLEGSIDSNYVRGLLGQVAARGWRGVLIHFRGCSGEPNRLARAYHSGETGDLRTVLRALRSRFPSAPIGAVGYSLGGNVLLKYLGEAGRDSGLAAAVGVSVPMHLSLCAQRLQRGVSRVYDRWLLGSLKASVRKKRALLAGLVEADERSLRRLRNLWEFDEHITAPLHGFAGAEDYYARASSRPYLARITTPTLILHSRDDPFMTEAVIPRPEELAPAVELELSPRGGHVGFVGGRPLAPTYWLEQRIPQFLAAHLWAAARGASRVRA